LPAARSARPRYRLAARWFCRAGQGVLRRRQFRRRLNAGQDGQRIDRDIVVKHLYIEGNRLFRTKKPIIAAVHGAAVGGGSGWPMVADFRIACPETRFCANFTRLGFHPGFGLTVTLPLAIGARNAAMMFYTSRRVPD